MRRNTLVSGAVIVFLVSLLSGCGWIGKKLVQSGQSQLLAETQKTQLDFVQVNVDAFKKCVTTWGGACDARTEEAKPGEFVQSAKIFRELFHGYEGRMVPDELSGLMSDPTVRLAERVLTSDTYAKLEDVFNFVGGHSGNELLVAKGGLFQFPLEKFLSFSKDMEDAVRFDAFQALYAGTDQAIKRLKDKKNSSSGAEKSQLESQLAKLEFGKKVAAYIASYTKAYFRDGHFAKMTLDSTLLESAIKSRLSASFPGLDINGPQFQEIFKEMKAGLPKDNGNYRLIGKISETSFKTRGGADYKFPAITATLKPGSREFITVSKVDFIAVGADLVRVFLEAVGDALAGVPGVTEATGCKIEELDQRLQEFDPGNPANPATATKLTMEEFGNVNDYANKVEGLISSLIGRVVRGANWFSLNNESVAVLIETAVGVMAKKASEKVIWCGYCVAHKEGATMMERDPTGVISVVPYGIGRREGETKVSGKFEIVGKEVKKEAPGPAE